jgi:hypothetical protein
MEKAFPEDEILDIGMGYFCQRGNCRTKGYWITAKLQLRI